MITVLMTMLIYTVFGHYPNSTVQQQLAQLSHRQASVLTVGAVAADDVTVKLGVNVQVNVRHATCLQQSTQQTRMSLSRGYTSEKAADAAMLLLSNKSHVAHILPAQYGTAQTNSNGT